MPANIEALTALTMFTLYFFAAGALLLACDGGDSFISDIAGWLLGISIVLLIGCTLGRVALLFCFMAGVAV